MQITTRHLNRARHTAMPNSPKRVESTHPVDSVELSQANSAHFEPASHLQRAASEFFSLVATHPSATEEFQHGLNEVKDIVGDIMYGGQWPEPNGLPKLPSHSFPGEPSKNGGLSRSEQLVSEDFVLIYRKTVNSVRNPQQHKRLASAIHLCQSVLQGRVLRRDYPNYWMSSPGTLQQDARREQQRWKL